MGKIKTIMGYEEIKMCFLKLWTKINDRIMEAIFKSNMKARKEIQKDILFAFRLYFYFIDTYLKSNF